MQTFNKTVLFTGADGRAAFREEQIALEAFKPQMLVSAVFPSGGYQLRYSPIGFRSPFHCSPTPQWVFILGGEMEIGLHDGSTRIFKAGQHFHSADVLPVGATFDPAVHGHWSAQVGADPLVTVFVRG